MRQQIDYYFTSISPFAYLGHRALLRIAQEYGAEIRYKPVKLSQVFTAAAVVPLAQRPVCRQQYRLLEIGRWAKKRGLPVNQQPAHFPTDPSLADRCAVAIQQQGRDAGDFIGRVLAACWAEEKNIADEAVIRQILGDLDLDALTLLEQAKTEAVETIYAANTTAAIEQGVLGAPAYLLNGEQFWGQDRLELLADALR
ncbi:2-hydroxychromene-2-carboxylate isomerase [Motiliproteus coralliicola]|uniref:2-hydroxychromene-2-carboxylate isomerase n=1 Tax=Motiliproteus coralliicola TaxID=2283196 RepID=A0A369WBZ3_9GAMM|nr:2-hydroxychromene-2-carboxylate isomerase [Motiliproteus coralliicola]RDE18833.1 2-hydroxychromene-2-carboxylate isomerase [Motiliproteus coralliicola]